GQDETVCQRDLLATVTVPQAWNFRGWGGLRSQDQMNFPTNRSLLVVVAGAAMVFNAGCATKKYVRNESAPVINKTNELDDLTAKNSRDIRDVDTRAQQGIQGVNQKAATADQKALAAAQAADQANQAAAQTAGKVDALTNTVANLDNYRPVAETSVHFAFNSAVLSKKAKEALDQLGNDIPNTKGYVIQLIGGTDSVGSKQYNYKLSEQRAAAVVQYLATQHDVPAYKIYVAGLGKDKEVAPNSTPKGRAQNRRVDVQLMTNVQENTAAQNNVSPAAPISR
ncbi:MAG TPA: OmpA family protein, partial [Terriglobales bacterium]|nr:OmpA family protein [Terriglobales bacterium]